MFWPHFFPLTGASENPLLCPDSQTLFAKLNSEPLKTLVLFLQIQELFSLDPFCALFGAFC